MEILIKKNILKVFVQVSLYNELQKSLISYSVYDLTKFMFNVKNTQYAWLHASVLRFMTDFTRTRIKENLLHILHVQYNYKLCIITC